MAKNVRVHELAKELGMTNAETVELCHSLGVPIKGQSSSLNEAYADKGLAVLGFPCNDFGAQEPGTLDEIKSFCSSTYGADFELFDKVNAKGSTTEPYTTLNKTEPAGDVAWNFEKFLVGKDGTVIARYKSDATPEALKAPIEAALAA